MATMGSRQITLLATLIAVFGLAGAHQRKLSGHGSSDLGDDSFDNRMALYKSWTKSTATRGRMLYEGPTPAPKGTAPAPGPSTGLCPWTHQQYVDNNVIMYWTGYANLTIPRDKLNQGVPDFVQCKALCDKDDNCEAWTRVAGGDTANNGNCYLLYDIKKLDASPAKYLFNHAGPNVDTEAYPQLRYVNQNLPIMFETGTKDKFFPVEYYGCPYATDGPGPKPLPPPPAPAPAKPAANIVSQPKAKSQPIVAQP